MSDVEYGLCSACGKQSRGRRDPLTSVWRCEHCNGLLGSDHPAHLCLSEDDDLRELAEVLLPGPALTKAWSEEATRLSMQRDRAIIVCLPRIIEKLNGILRELENLTDTVVVLGQDEDEDGAVVRVDAVTRCPLCGEELEWHDDPPGLRWHVHTCGAGAEKGPPNEEG